MYATNPHECIRKLYMVAPTGGKQMLRWEGRNQGTNQRWERDYFSHPVSCAPCAGYCGWWQGKATNRRWREKRAVEGHWNAGGGRKVRKRREVSLLRAPIQNSAGDWTSFTRPTWWGPTNTASLFTIREGCLLETALKCFPVGSVFDSRQWRSQNPHDNNFNFSRTNYFCSRCKKY
jgi:hypothetical protein